MSDTSTSRSVADSPRVRLLIALFGLLAALNAIGVGSPPALLDIDPSWTAVLGWARATGQGFGTDLVFTYGPLGFLLPFSAYVPAVYNEFLVGQMLLGGLLGFGTALALARMPRALRLPYVLLLLAWLPWLDTDVLWLLNAGHALVAMLGPTGWQPGPPGAWRLGTASALGLTVAAFGLLKFSMLPPGLLVAVLGGGALVLQSRRREALAFTGSAWMGVPVIWSLAGQPLTGLPSFLAGAAEVAAGYGGAMGLTPRLAVDVAGFTCMALCGGWLGLQAWRHRREPDVGLALVALGCVVFAGWRAGFTRADAHIEQAFPVLSLMVALGAALRRQPARWLDGLGIAAVAITLASGLAAAAPAFPERWIQRLDRIPAVASALLRRDALRHQRETWAEERRAELPMAALRDRIGDATVDVMNWEQGALILHELNYRPRPVFQGYSAYTPALARRNEAFYLGPDAPRYVLLKLQAIDNRLPASDDALALAAVLRRYAPVAVEDGWLVLSRGDGQAPTPLPDAPAGREVALGQWVYLAAADTAAQILYADVRPTLVGRAYAFWFRGTPLLLDVRTRDGEEASYRIVPDVLRAGVIVSPAFAGTPDLLRHLTGLRLPPVVAFRLRPAIDRHAVLFAPQANVASAPLDWTLPDPASLPVGLRDTEAAGFGREPDRREGLVERLVERGRNVLLLHSPAGIGFGLAAGRWQVTGEAGVRDAMAADSACAAISDGVRVSLEAQAPGRPARGLWQLDLDPVRQPTHRGPQAISATIMLESGEILWLRMLAGPPSAQSACDWGWVQGIDIVPAGDAADQPTASEP